MFKKIMFIAGIVLLVIAAIAFSTFIIKLLWGWTVPDLFPGAVEQGLIVGVISWLTAFKIILFAATIIGGARFSYNKNLK